MKFLWKQFQELYSNKAIFVLTVLQFILSICCYQVCYSITNTYISTNLYLSSNFKDNSVNMSVGELTKAEGNQIVSAVEDTTGFYSINFDAKLYQEDADEQEEERIVEILSVCSFSKSAFTDTKLDIRGENIDFDRDYEGKVPVILSYMLGKTYDVGETIKLDGAELYVCGVLENDKFYYYAQPASSQWFVMAYDEEGVLYSQDRVLGDTIFLTAHTDTAYEKICDENTFSSIRDEFTIKKYDYKDSISGLFKSVSSFLIIGVWIVILSTYSLLSSNYMAFKRNETRYRIQLCIGARKTDILVNYIIRMILCILISTPLSAILFLFVSKIVPNLYLTKVAVICGLIVTVVVTVISIIALTIKIKRFQLVGAISNE